MATIAAGQGLRFDMTEAEVRAAAGNPTSSLSRGGRAIWMYPGGGRVEFENGRAVSIENMTLASQAEIAAAEAEKAAAEAAARREAEEARLAEEAAAQAELTEMEVEFEAQRAAMQADMEDAVANLEAQYGGAQAAMRGEDSEYYDDYEYEEPGVLDILIGLGVGAVISLLITIVILKLAFKWSDIHADWSQMVVPAIADVVTKTGIEVIAEYVLKAPSVFYLDYALSYIVLVFVLMKTTHASSLARAVTVAGAAKLASIVVWALLSVFILQSMFG